MRTARPEILISSSASDHLSVDADGVAKVMNELGITAETIRATTIYFDHYNYVLINGITYPNLLGRVRYLTIPVMRQTNGPIVRVSSRVQGKWRSARAMNVTLVHELEHVAQMDRRDRSRKIGQLGRWVLTAVAASFGVWLTAAGGRWRAGYILGLAIIGHVLGYVIAPHEAQARKRARLVEISAIKRVG